MSPRGRYRKELPALDSGQLPATLVDHPVVAVAEQDQIVHVARAAVAPVHHVMRIGERHRAIATGPFASTGPNPQCRSGGRAWHPQRPADVDHRGIRSEEDAADTGITREALHRCGRDRPGEFELAARCSLQAHHRLDRGGELEVGARPARGGDRSEVKGVAGDLDQRVGEAAGKRPVVACARASGEGEYGGLDRRSGDGVEETTHRHEAALAGNELAAVALRGGHVFLENCGWVVDVASVVTVTTEAADRVLPGQLQQGAFIEGGGAETLGVIRVGSAGAGADGTSNPRQQRETEASARLPPTPILCPNRHSPQLGRCSPLR